MPKKKYICPYCFSKNNIEDVEFRCSNMKTIKNVPMCKAVLDEKASDFLGHQKLDKLVFKSLTSVKGKMPKSEQCPECKEVSLVRICPHCHSRLPDQIDMDEDIIFSIIGAKETGKSHYIAVLINEIRRNLSGEYNLSIASANDETSTRYKRDFYAPIFERKETIKATQSAIANEDVRTPLIYTLKVQNNGSQKIKSVTLAFFDTAGEDLDDSDTMATVNKYIYNSECIFLLLDPLQLKEVRAKLDKKIPLPQVNTEIETIITRTTQLIRNANKIKGNKLIDIPIAVCFTKIDALKEIMEAGCNVFNPRKPSAKTRGFFDMNNYLIINDEMMAYLMRWSGADLIQQVKMNYKDYGFFGVSSLGSAPVNNVKISDFKPIRVADPLLWALYQMGIIKEK